MNCIVPGSAGLSSSFVSSACWIQGLYVYEELKYDFDRVAYYGENQVFIKLSLTI